MKRSVFCWSWLLAIPMFLAGCGGDDGESGTLSVGITDAKPLLPADTQQVSITFDEVLVHRSGGSWISVPMVESPYTIDLLLFSDGKTTRIVPPAELEAGKYTQIRFGIESGQIVTSEGTFDLEIPSQYLKTDKQFDFDVDSGGAVNLVVDFDLSQSIVQNAGGYQLKPVIHLNETQNAATIHGVIAAETFQVDAAVYDAVVTVTHGDDTYTEVVVTRTSDVEPTEFRIFWLVPNQEYLVEVEVNGSCVFDEVVAADGLGPGFVFPLNDVEPQEGDGVPDPVPSSGTCDGV